VHDALQTAAPAQVRPPGAPWSQRDAAAFLGVSLSTVERAVRDGRLASIRIGRRRLVPAEALQKLLAAEASP